MEEEDENRQISLRLFNILDRVGASEKLRHFYNKNIVNEIICTLYFTLKKGYTISAYHFGSYSEGTFLPGMGSDIDMLLCYMELFVHADIRTCPEGLSLLLVHEGSYPGYVKLQRVVNSQPLNVHHMEPVYTRDFDSQGRMCLNNVLLRSQGYEWHGPANSRVFEDDGSVDHVLAFRCVTVPGFAKKWADRCRRKGWPSQQLITEMSEMNCFVVGVGHELSPERHLEWRLSFSLQERELMLHLNPVQHKCYILMKLIKKDVIQPVVGEGILTSYHCKTILFHVIANNPRDIWRPDNLIYCLMLCFLYMYRAVDAAYCPLFFLTDANLFDRESFRRQRTSLLRKLETIIQLDYKIILHIKCSDIGYSFIHQRINQHIVDNIITSKLEVYLNTSGVMHAFNKFVCRLLRRKNNITENILAAYNILRVLTKIKEVMDHTEQQTIEAFSLIIPHIHHRLAISIAAYALESRDDQKRERLLRLFERHFQYVEHVDVIAATLTYVTVMFSMGEYELCRAMLEEKEGSLSDYTISYCTCGTNVAVRDSFLPKLNIDDLSLHHLITNYVLSCITFLPSEHTIVHPALKLEMVRSKDTIPESRDEENDFWFDWAVVDGKVYFYFLQYLVYSKLNKPIHKQVVIDNLKWVIGDDRNLHHKETAYNLLGWIYKEENRVEEAMQCWRKSWEIRPHHNAAKWHYTLLMMNRAGSPPST